MPVEITMTHLLMAVGAIGAGIGWMIRELRLIHAELSAVATLALMNADENDMDVPDRVEDDLLGGGGG